MAEEQGNKKERKISSLFTKILFAIAGIVIIILIATTIVILVPRLFSSAGSIGNSLGKIFGKESKIELRTNVKSVSAGEAINLSWENNYKKPHFYTVEYDCNDNFILGIVTNIGLKEFECNKKLPIGLSNQIQLIPDLKEDNSFYDTIITVTLVDEETGKDEITGNTIVTVTKGDPTIVKFDEKEHADNLFSKDSDNTNNDYTDSKTQSNKSPVVSKEDSYYDPVTGVTFYNTGYSNQSETPSYQDSYNKTNNGSDIKISNIISTSNKTIRFTATNAGNMPTGVWYFKYSTPNSPVRIQESPFQISLEPNQSMIITIDFDDADNGLFNINIELDPNNRTRDINRGNNYGSVFISSNYSRTRSVGGIIPSSNKKADLEITNLEAGYISRSGKFIEDDVVDKDDNTAIRFYVINRGNIETGYWRYSISVSDGNNERSGRQSSLHSGERDEIIVELDLNANRRQKIEVDVDYRNEVDESNERNNTESIIIKVDN